MVRYGTGSDQSTNTRPFPVSISLLSWAQSQPLPYLGIFTYGQTEVRGATVAGGTAGIEPVLL